MAHVQEPQHILPIWDDPEVPDSEGSDSTDSCEASYGNPTPSRMSKFSTPVNELIAEIVSLCPPPVDGRFSLPRLALSEHFVFEEWQQTELEQVDKSGLELPQGVKDALLTMWLKYQVSTTWQYSYRTVLQKFGLTRQQMKRVYRRYHRKHYLQRMTYINDLPIPDNLKPEERSVASRFQKALELWLNVCKQRVEHFFEQTYKETIQDGIELRDSENPDHGFIILEGYEWIDPAHCIGGKILDFKQCKEPGAVSAAEIQASLQSSWIYLLPDDKVALMHQVLSLATKDPSELPFAFKKSVEREWKDNVLKRLMQHDQLQKNALRSTLKSLPLQEQIWHPDFEFVLHALSRNELNQLFEQRSQNQVNADYDTLQSLMDAALASWRKQCEPLQEEVIEGLVNVLEAFQDDLRLVFRRKVMTAVQEQFIDPTAEESLGSTSLAKTDPDSDLGSLLLLEYPVYADQAVKRCQSLAESSTLSGTFDYERTKQAQAASSDTDHQDVQPQAHYRQPPTTIERKRKRLRITPSTNQCSSSSSRKTRSMTKNMMSL